MKVNGATSSKSSLRTTIPGNLLLPPKKKVSFRDGVQGANTPVKADLEDVCYISPKVVSQDSIAPASSPPPLDLSEEMPRARNRLGCLGSFLPNCLYDLICFIFCLSDEPSPSEEVVEIEGQRLVSSPIQESENLPIEPPLVHLERWFEKMCQDLRKSNYTRSARVAKTHKRVRFDGCQALLLVKVTFPKKDPLFFTHKKFYDAEKYDDFPGEIENFYRSNLSGLEQIAGYEALFITIHPNLVMPSVTLTGIDSSSFNTAHGKPKDGFTSSSDNEDLKKPKKILKKFPLLQEGNVSVADLTPPN